MHRNLVQKQTGVTMDVQEIKSTDDILFILCKSIQRVLQKATAQKITFFPLAQTINKTTLRPDIGCFTVFESEVSGIVLMNFSAEAALDIYRSYMMNMKMPEDELSRNHTSDDVGNVLGALVDQGMGHFQNDLREELYASVRFTPPKMMVVNQDITISVGNLPQAPDYRRVSFETESHRPFFLELGVEKTAFSPFYSHEKEESGHEPVREKTQDVDDIFLEAQKAKARQEHKDES